MTTNNNWQDLAADLPARRDDEPPSLRDDIVAELEDHLACAMNRERHATGDEDRAQKNVIEKFGNPAAIAYRLWWDAMKERIMSQRILIGTVVLLAIACLAATGFAWIAVQEGREVNRVMLEKLSEISTTVLPATDEAVPDPMQWVPVRFKLVLDEASGAPAQGFRATLLGKVFDNEETTVDFVSGKDGIVNFNYLKPGHYRMSVEAPWNEMHNEYLVVMPGTPIDKTIVCPSKPIDEIEVKFEVDWPEDLMDQDLRLACPVKAQPRRIGGFIWIQATRSQPNVYSDYWLLFQPTGEAVIYPHSLSVSAGQIRPNAASTNYDVFELKPVHESGLPFRATDLPSLSFQDAINFANLPAEIDRMFVVMPSMTALAREVHYNQDAIDSDDQGFPIVASWPQEVDFLPNGVFLGANEKYVVIPSSDIPDESTEKLTFVPRPDEENIWTIELPESLIARTREALKAIDEFKAEHAKAESAATE